MVNGIEDNLLNGNVIGRLGSEKKFASDEKHDNELPHCASIATR